MSAGTQPIGIADFATSTAPPHPPHTTAQSDASPHAAGGGRPSAGAVTAWITAPYELPYRAEKGPRIASMWSSVPMSMLKVWP